MDKGVLFLVLESVMKAKPVKRKDKLKSIPPELQPKRHCVDQISDTAPDNYHLGKYFTL